jgi:hypothetical protein
MGLQKRWNPMRPSSSRARWLVAAAASCAALGVLLKLALGGSGSPVSPRVPVATMAQPSGADSRVRGPDGRQRERAEPEDDAGSLGAHEAATPGPPTVGAGFPPDRPSALGRAQAARERRRLRKARREAFLRAKREGRRPTIAPDADGNVPRDVVEHGEQFATATPVEADDLAETVAGEKGSVAFWFQPHWQAGNQDDATFIDMADGQFRLTKNVDFLRLQFTDVEGGTHSMGVPITQWESGEWHQIAASWDGNVFQLYLDGELVREASIDSPFSLPEKTRVLLGSDFQNRPIAPGVMGGLDARNDPLSPDEAKRRYEAGAAG